jgi:hypothetical protein
VIASVLPTIQPGGLLAAAVTAAAASLWLMLPRGQSGGRERLARRLGGLLGLVALAGFIAAGRRLGSLGEEGVFLTVALVAVVSAAATIVSRSPVYSAIWFALALAGALVGRPLEEVEKLFIAETLKLTAGNREQAADLLGIGERTLYRKIKEFNL